MFLFVGEVVFLYVVDILADGAGDLAVEAEVAAEEAGLEFGGDAEEVMHNEDLAVAVFAGADADDRNMEALGDRFCEGGGDLFEDDTGAAGFFEQLGVFFEFFGFYLFFGADVIGAEFVNGLGCQSEMADDGYPGGQDTVSGFQYFGAAFEFDGVGAGLFHDADGGGECFL